MRWHSQLYFLQTRNNGLNESSISGLIGYRHEADGP